MLLSIAGSSPIADTAGTWFPHIDAFVFVRCVLHATAPSIFFAIIALYCVSCFEKTVLFSWFVDQLIYVR